MLQGLAHQPCTAGDWKDLVRAVLPSSQFLKWHAFFRKECRVQAERNQAANLPTPFTYRMLSGTSDQFFTGLQQATIPVPIKIRRWGWLLERKWRRVSLNPDHGDHPKVY